MERITVAYSMQLYVRPIRQFYLNIFRIKCPFAFAFLYYYQSHLVLIYIRLIR